MAFFKRDKNKDCQLGRVYLFEFILDDNTLVYKVGMVNSDSMSRVTDRLMEVLRSFFMTYRYIPRSRIVKAKKYKIPYIVENHFHSLLDDIKYSFDKKFDGSNEFFTDLDVDMFKEYMDTFEYIELLRGETSMPKDRYEKIKTAIREAELEKNPADSTDDVPF